MAQVVIAGSNGEAVALSIDERLKLVALAREIASRCGRADMPIVIGTVGQTTRDIVSQLHAATEAGADFGLVLTPSYFHFAMDATAIREFFLAVCLLHPLTPLIEDLLLTYRIRLPTKAPSRSSSTAGRSSPRV